MFTRFVGLIHLSVIMPPFYSAVSFDSVSFDSVSFDSVSFDSDSIDSDSIDSDSIDSDSIDSMVGWLSAASARTAMAKPSAGCPPPALSVSLQQQRTPL